MKAIINQLDNWRKARKLTKEGQERGYTSNLLEELTEYTRAKTIEEKIDALCDIAVFTINSFDINVNEIEKIKGLTLTNKEVACHFMSLYDTGTPEEILTACFRLMKGYGYNYKKAMQETIKEISSRRGRYDAKIGKFVKSEGAYTLKEVQEKYPTRKIYENLDNFEVWAPNGCIEVVKWVKANYDNAKL